VISFLAPIHNGTLGMRD